MLSLWNSALRFITKGDVDEEGFGVKWSESQPFGNPGAGDLWQYHIERFRTGRNVIRQHVKSRQEEKETV